MKRVAEWVIGGAVVYFAAHIVIGIVRALERG
jgi:hypothetical protein